MFTGAARRVAPTVDKEWFMISAGQIARYLLCLILLLAITACSGLSGEPQIVATLPPATAKPPELGYPPSSPDLANGAQIFAARCASCHGVSGDGQGVLFTSGQLAVNGTPQPPGNFTDPNTMREQTPKEWFDTITNGRIEKMMPPWANALTEQERWDVAMYTYTLHYTSEQLSRGIEIWESECIDCHGAQGRGDGPDAARVGKKVGNLTDQKEMSIVSDSVIYNFIAEGSADAMPAFAEELSVDDIWAVAAYARALSLQNRDVMGAAPAEPAATEEAGVSGTITGRITNGTAGGEVPPGLKATLFIFDSQFSSQRYETVSDAEGNFRFDDVTISTDFSYAVTVTYRERAFASEIVRGTSPALELPVTIYELTEDTAVLTITGLVYQINAIGDGLQVAQVMIIKNSSDRLFTSNNQVRENQFASVVITLPPGAIVLGFPDNQQRYIVSEDQKTVIDTAPVLPNEDHVIQIIYLVPYETSAIIEQPINYALEGPVRLLIRPDTVRASSALLPAIGPQTVGEGTYSGYGATLTLDQGAIIRFELSGAGAATVSDVQTPVVSPNNLAVVAVLALIAVISIVGGLYIFYVRRGNATQQAESLDKNRMIDLLAQQIAELDEAHDRGDINHDFYHHQRKQLKARLAELMGEKAE
jgi:mono/diheme cytochrome c family protein